MAAFQKRGQAAAAEAGLQAGSACAKEARGVGTCNRASHKFQPLPLDTTVFFQVLKTDGLLNSVEGTKESS